MTDNTHQSEFDDELLSAYLDDELSPAERARVDERLAADPAARALMEQMRAVSLAVRRLPVEKLDVDLRESILARAEQAKQTDNAKFARFPAESSSNVSPATTPEIDRPRLSFGRTRRGWFWAGLAVAAAILMAFILPKDHGQNVAVRRKPASDEPRFGAAEMRAVPAPASPVDQVAQDAPAPAPVPANEAAPAAAQVADLYAGAPSRGMAAPQPAPSAQANAPLSEIPTESAFGRRAAEPAARYAPPMEAPADDALGRGTNFSAPPAAAMAGGRSGAKVAADGAPTVEQDFVIVHVSATPEAIENKSFEQMLASNGIAFDEPAREEEAVESTLPGGQTAGALADESKAIDTATPVAQVEMVLVEAPTEQITACLNTLRNDAANYVAVEVEGDAPQQSARVRQQVAALNLSQFSRGAISLQQKERYAPVKNNYFEGRVAKQENETAQKLERHSDKQLGVPEPATDNANNLARARRVQSLDRRFFDSAQTPADAAGKQQSAFRESASTETGRSAALARKAADGSIAGDQLQVLFVISPEEAPATSPAAASSPQ